MKKLVLGSFAMLMLTACSDKVPQEAGAVQTYFCPQDNCTQQYIDRVHGKAAKCAFYELKHSGLEAALAQSDVIVYNKNHHGFGTPVKSSGYMHNKFCVIGDTVITGSFNPTPNGHSANNNNVVVINSSRIASNYRAEFTEIKYKLPHQKTKHTRVNVSGIVIENYFCPEDKCAQKLVEKINGAQKSIDFMTFSFTHPDVADALTRTKVPVRGLFEKRNAGSKYAKDDMLAAAGCAIHYDTNKKAMHHKVFIIDDMVITGSFNPSKNGDTRNDENMLIIHNAAIASKYRAEMNRLLQ